MNYKKHLKGEGKTQVESNLWNAVNGEKSKKFQTSYHDKVLQEDFIKFKNGELSTSKSIKIIFKTLLTFSKWLRLDFLSLEDLTPKQANNDVKLNVNATEYDIKNLGKYSFRIGQTKKIINNVAHKSPINSEQITHESVSPVSNDSEKVSEVGIVNEVVDADIIQNDDTHNVLICALCK